MMILALKKELLNITYSTVCSFVISIFFYLISNIKHTVNYDTISRTRDIHAPSTINALCLHSKMSMKIGSQKGYQISQVSPKEAESHFSSYSANSLINNYLKGNLVMISQGKNQIVFFDRSQKDDNNLILVTILPSMLKNSMIYLNVPRF